MPNIILENGNHLRTTQCFANEAYGLESLLFYLPLNYNKSQVFLILKDTQGLYEIVELKKMKKEQNHVIYQVAINQNIRVTNDLMNLAILIFNADGSYLFSEDILMNITVDKYIIAKQINLVQQIGVQVQDYYKKIIALTEENKKIYNDMKGDHLS